MTVSLRWPAPGLPAQAIERLVGRDAPFELVTDHCAGFPRQLFRQRPRSLAEVLVGGAERFGDRPYLVFPERTLTFASVVEAAARVASGLRRHFGIGPGDRVAVASANRCQYALAFWAATLLGAVTVALNGWWTGDELAYGIELSDPALIVTDARRRERLASQVVAAPVCSMEETFPRLEDDAPLPLGDRRGEEDEPLVLLFTSGTTGRPKAVPLSHRNVIHFALANQLRAAELRERARLAGMEPAPPSAPCAIASSPMFHVSGLTCTMVPGPMTGLRLVYPPPGRWQEEVHLGLTEQHRATGWSLVPTQLWRLLDHPDLDRYDLRSLTTVAGGGAVWPPELLRRLGERLPWVRPAVGLGYGATETNGLGTLLGGPATFSHPDSVGQAAPTVEVEVRDPVSHRPLGEGQVGEIALRSASTFAGYWRDPSATEAALAQGWYHTGDLGYHRQGFVHLAARRSDLVIRGGENVSPVEVENRLWQHRAVAEVAVVGLPHERLGQQVAVFVVRRSGAGATTEELRAFCAETLAHFKVPEMIVLVDSLPHNASGKVLKHRLAGEAAEPAFIEE